MARGRERVRPRLATAELQVAALGLVLAVVVPPRSQPGCRSRRAWPLVVPLHRRKPIPERVSPRADLDGLTLDLYEGAPAHGVLLGAARPGECPRPVEPVRRIAGHGGDLDVPSVHDPVVAVPVVVPRLVHHLGPGPRLLLVGEPQHLRLARRVVPAVLRRVEVRRARSGPDCAGALRPAAAGQGALWGPDVRVRHGLGPAAAGDCVVHSQRQRLLVAVLAPEAGRQAAVVFQPASRASEDGVGHRVAPAEAAWEVGHAHGVASLAGRVQQGVGLGRHGDRGPRPGPHGARHRPSRLVRRLDGVPAQAASAKMA
mmetsp:Transcript_15799/g.45026  ORF Transcript_15799/g.45026 Transcript_15799/m.45026 type:complete len:314 (-) Transcript_15799:3-944(-)